MSRRLLALVAVALALLGGLIVWTRLEPDPPVAPIPVQGAPTVTSIPAASPSASPPPQLADASTSPADAAVAERAHVDSGTAVVDAGVTPAPIETLVAAAEVATPTALTTVDSTPRKPNDPRFTIRWGKAGLCGDEPLERLAERRAALLATFIGVRRAGTQIFHDPDASLTMVDFLGESITEARSIATRLLGPGADVQLPVIYLYASHEQMRGVACVNTATQGYYDGAIHLPATDVDAYRTVVHEHIHHVLNSLGFRKPMWFHEGLAMYAADERWWQGPRLGLTTWLRSKHLPFPALTEAFPHTADELFAGAAYYQSYTMVAFVGAQGGHSDFSWLVDGVVSGKFSPQTCFSEAVGLPEDQLESSWSAFVQSR